MPTIDSLQKEIDSLKEQNKKIIQQLVVIQKNQGLPGKNFSVEEKVVTPKVQETISQESTPVGGIILTVIGALLCITIIGLVIGLPLLIWGIYLINKKSSTKTEEKAIEMSVETPKVVHQKPKKEKSTFEEDVGMKWFARIGILALVIGVGFFIKYSIDMNWINHLTRIVLGVVFGIGLIVFGEFMSKKEQYVNWAKTLVGGGFAITYFVIFAAYNFLDYRRAIGISQTLDILLLSIVVLFAIIYSIKDNSQIIAAESFFLGYVTSLLSNNIGFMTILYGLLLTVGLVIVVSYKKWSVIGLGGVFASYLMYFIWKNSNPESFMYASFILITYFLAFTLQSFFLVKKKELFGQNISLILINSSLFFILYYLQINAYYPNFTGLFTLLYSVLFLALYLISQKYKEIKYSITYLYLGILYLTLTIPIQLNSELVTIIWALETLILTIMFLKFNNNTLRISSYIVGVFTGFKTLIYDTNMLHKIDYANIINSTRLISFIATIICFYLIYRLLKVHKEEYQTALIYSWAATILFVLITCLELIMDNSLWITIILSLLTIYYIIISIKKNTELRKQAIAISGILFLKLLIYDFWKLNDFDFNNLISSTRTIAFLITIITFYFISKYLDKNEKSLSKNESILTQIYSIAGTSLAFLLIIIEMKGFYISVGWSILALIIMIRGISQRKKHLRMQGMIIFAITIVKVFLYDTRSLETIFRTISYVVLGIILLLVSFIYTKYKEKLKEIL